MHLSIDHQVACLTNPIGSSVVMGGVFTALGVAQGSQFTPRMLGGSIAFIYIYNALQCPLEAIWGRRSLWHNCIAGGTLGYLAVATGNAGVPLLDYTFFISYPMIRPAVAGAFMYGVMGGAFGAMGGKGF